MIMVEILQLWAERMLASGAIDAEQYQAANTVPEYVMYYEIIHCYLRFIDALAEKYKSHLPKHIIL